MDSAEGYSEDGSHRPPSNIAFHSMFHHDRRRRYAVALRVTAKLKESNLIDQRSRAALKELILDDDSRVFAAVENFFSDNDVQKVNFGETAATAVTVVTTITTICTAPR